MLNSKELREIVQVNDQDEIQLEGMTKIKINQNNDDDSNAKREEKDRYESPRSSFVREKEFDPNKMMESSPAAPASKPPMTSSKCESEAKLPEPARF